jgi:hypothetical protein
MMCSLISGYQVPEEYDAPNYRRMCTPSEVSLLIYPNTRRHIIIIIIIIIITIVVSCHKSFLPGTSLEPAVIQPLRP